MELAEKFITDTEGNRIGVLLSIEDYQKLLEAWEALKGIQGNENVMMSDNPDLTLEKMRPSGLCEGEFVVPDNFDNPLPEDILQGFESKKVNRFWDSLQKFRQSQEFQESEFDEAIFNETQHKKEVY